MSLTREEKRALAARVRMGEVMPEHEYWRGWHDNWKSGFVFAEVLGVVITDLPFEYLQAAAKGDTTSGFSPKIDAAILAWLEAE